MAPRRGSICWFRRLCDPGDVIISEEPTWSGAVQTFRAAGAEVVTVPLDAHGTNVDALEQELQRLAEAGRRAKIFYTIPELPESDRRHDAT